MSNPTELPDLEACPFCGNEAEMIDNGTGSWRVACLQSKGGCGATGRMTFDGGATAAREWNSRAQPEGEAPQAELVELLKAIRPNYGDVGSRDVDVTAQRKRIDRAIELLSAPAATLSPLCGAQHADEAAAARAWADENVSSDAFDPAVEAFGAGASWLAAQQAAASN